MYYIVFSYSPWDIKECLFPQCVLARVPFPSYATKWIDVRKMFSSFYQVRWNSLATMLEGLGLEFEGREHSGIDDTRNIARVISQIIKDGAVLKYNRFISNDLLQQFNIRSSWLWQFWLCHYSWSFVLFFCPSLSLSVVTTVQSIVFITSNTLYCTIVGEALYMIWNDSITSAYGRQ